MGYKELLQPSGWIWLNNFTLEEQNTPVLVCFRKELVLEKVPESMVLMLSADTRYKFYVNGKLVCLGPQRGDQLEWYYDEADIAPYLQKGINVLAAMVLRYPYGGSNGNYGMIRTETPGFYLREKDGSLIADNTFRAKRNPDFHIVPEAPGFSPMQIYEQVTGNKEFQEFLKPGFDDSDWEEAFVYPHLRMRAYSAPGNLLKRTIPHMVQTPAGFKEISAVRESLYGSERWLSFLAGKEKLVIPAGHTEIVEISAGEEMTGYLELGVAGGKGSVIRILQSEAYYQVLPTRYDRGKKTDRTDSVNGTLFGYADIYEVGGYGTEESTEIYEPFYLRTFRFIRLEIRAEEELELCCFRYRKTEYPLEVRSHVTTGDPTMEEIWKISERTLKRCMLDTYVDCPFYEQLQYAMDARSQILYTYAASADDRLARSCMNAFKNSVRDDGMIECCYPASTHNVIPGFSIYYIGMLYDHMMYFGDRELLRDHFRVMDGILRYFERHLDDRRIVGKIGGPQFNIGYYWSFIDWTPQWNENGGVPSASLKGPITMESLLYVMGLQYASAIAEYLGRTDMAREYADRAAGVQNALNTYCRDERGFYQDGPGIREYSAHAQVFAILTGTVSAQEGRKLLQEALEDKEKYAPCSVAMAYYLFRAMEMTGMYERTDKEWEVFRDMIRSHCTTWVEDPVTSRSECHAWGSLALYELPSVILGVRPAAPGYARVSVDPVPGYLDHAHGEAVTPRGIVSVSWKKDEMGNITVNAEIPEGMERI